MNLEEILETKCPPPGGLQRLRAKIDARPEHRWRRPLVWAALAATLLAASFTALWWSSKPPRESTYQSWRSEHTVAMTQLGLKQESGQNPEIEPRDGIALRLNDHPQIRVYQILR